MMIFISLNIFRVYLCLYLTYNSTKKYRIKSVSLRQNLMLVRFVSEKLDWTEPGFECYFQKPDSNAT